MKDFYAAVKRSKLFGGIGEEELRSMLRCLSAEEREYRKAECVLRFGDKVDSIGLVLSGAVDVVREDCWGNRNIVAAVLPGQSFAESYACCVPGAALGVSVQAARDSEILFVNIRKVLTTCTSACAFHARLIRNLVSLLAAKNLSLNEKLTHLSQRSIREKLLSYLSSVSMERNSPVFDIPFDRQQLADYLSVDRSALSNELSKMKREGVLKFDRNHFSLSTKAGRGAE